MDTDDTTTLTYSRHNVYRSIPLIFESLQGHQDHLRIVQVHWDERKIRFEDDYAVNIDFDGTLPRADVFDFSSFSQLVYLYLPLPMLLGPGFFYKKPSLYNWPSVLLSSSIPEPGFGTDFRDAIANNLPRSLVFLTLLAVDAYQVRALSHALTGLIEQLRDVCPLLSYIQVCLDRWYDFEEHYRSFLEPAARDKGLTLQCDNLDALC